MLRDHGAMSETATADGAYDGAVMSHAALTHPAAYPMLRVVTPRYADLGGDGLVSAMGLGRWFEDARVGVALPGFRRLVEGRRVRGVPDPARRAAHDRDVADRVDRSGGGGFGAEIALGVCFSHGLYGPCRHR